MTSNDSEDRFDWDRAEADVSDVADVVDLDAERARRDGADEGTARIAAAGQRRADRAAAADGLTRASAADAESLTPDQVREGVPVDPPEPPTNVWELLNADRQRVPVLPRWVTDRQTRRGAVRRAGRLIGYQVGTHLVRSPWYAVKVGWYAPKGAGRLVSRVLTWASAESGNFGLRQHAATHNDARTWLELDKHRMRQTSWRWWVTGAGAAVTIGAGVVLWSHLLPWWIRLPILVGGVLGLARLGRPAGKPIVERTIVRAAYRRLTAELTRRGIMATGLVKRPEDIEFRAGDIRRDGPGYLAVVDLPDGVIATDVINKREQLAGGLRLPIDQVWPETIRGEHPSRMALWVADKPVSAMRQPAWPHTGGTTDYFAEFVYGFDPRMRPVMYRMDERNSLFAGMPGSGKSLSARVVLAAMALDPLVTFAVFDLAGRGDFDMFEPLCAPALFGSGADDGTKERAYRMIMWLLKECDTRGPLIKHYATKEGLNSENKLNRAIAQRDPRLRPIVASIDEVQELITDPDLGKAVQAALTSIIKRGRALGIHLMLETQRIDNQSLPKGVTSNIAMRTCLSVPSHTEVELALGTGTYNQGARPNQFEIGVDAGWGVRVGYGPMRSVRAAYLDRAAVEAICARGVKLRGGRVGDVDLPPARDLLADLQNIWVGGEAGQHYATLAGRLAERFPDAYGAINEEALSAMARALGLTSRQVKVKGINRNGLTLKQITEAAAARGEQTD